MGDNRKITVARRELSTLFGCVYIVLCVRQALLDSFVAGDYENLL